MWRYRAALLAWLAIAGCKDDSAASPEAVADAFCEAYFRQANQEKAKEYTAFGATKMLDQEIADVRALRESGYTPSEAENEVGVSRGERTQRDERVRFDYTLRYRGPTGVAVKHADIELAKVHGEWKVVRIGVASEGETKEAQ
jgi:hypothetical protein